MRAINVLLALLVSFGLAFGVAEGGLRLLGFGPPAVNTQFDESLGWSKEPNSRVVNKSAEYKVDLKVDALGLRDDFTDGNPAKPEGTTRVLCLGDSFVLGYTVDRSDLFVDQLESAWAAEGRKIDVVNAGTQAYSTDQALLWLESNGASFTPDVVMLFPYENDIWWNASETYLDQDKPVYGEDGKLTERTLAEPTARTAFQRTAIGHTAGGIIARIQGEERMPKVETPAGGAIPVEMSSRLVEPPEATRIAEERTRLLVSRMAQVAQGMGAEFVVCPIPSKAQMPGAKAPSEELIAKTGPMDPSRPYGIFVDAAKAAGARVLEPLESLRAAAESDEAPYYARDFHLDPSGNVVLANFLKDALDEASLVPALPEGKEPTRPTGSGGGGMPAWPFWFLGLWGVLGTAYARTYSDESAGAAYLKVAGLLGVVFATALGVNALVGALPAKAGQLLLVGLVLALLTFVLYKLGDRVGTIGELLKAFTMRGHWYLMPLLSVLLTVGSLLVVAASSPLVAPFIYTLF